MKTFANEKFNFSLNCSRHLTYLVCFLKANHLKETNKIAIWQDVFLGILCSALL